MKVTVSITKKLNKEISKFIKKNGGCYFDKFPIKQINDCFKRHNFELLNEDGTKFCGENGRASINYGKLNDVVENSTLYFSWYKVSSGRYEIIMYV